MRKFILVLVLTTFSLFGASFDCTKAKSDVEKAICQDDELSKLDEKLSSFYIEILDGTFSKEEQENIKQAQRNWIKERNECKVGLIDCLVDKYKLRLTSLGFYQDQYFFGKPPIEESIVKYDLVLSENDILCSSLLNIYNEDIEQFQKVNYDNHAEFNWLKLEAYVKPNPKKNITSDELIGGAFFDINNDGKEDFIFAKYSYLSTIKTENYFIYDHNVSDFFKQSPMNGNTLPQFVISFDNIGNSDTTLIDKKTRNIDEISFSLIAKSLDKLPAYMVQQIQHYRKFSDKQNEIGFSPVPQKNEIRFLKWNDGKLYIVFEGSDKFGNRNQFNLVGHLQPNYTFNPECLFYKKIR